MWMTTVCMRLIWGVNPNSHYFFLLQPRTIFISVHFALKNVLLHCFHLLRLDNNKENKIDFRRHTQRAHSSCCSTTKMPKNKHLYITSMIESKWNWVRSLHHHSRIVNAVVFIMSGSITCWACTLWAATATSIKNKIKLCQNIHFDIPEMKVYY